jgi:Ca2+:H+ antiporter
VADPTPDVGRVLSVDRILLVLLLSVPVTLTMVWGFGLHGTPVFIAAAVSIIPLAGYMGRATERLSEHLGAGWGGLLNA